MFQKNIKIYIYLNLCLYTLISNKSGKKLNQIAICACAVMFATEGVV